VAATEISWHGGRDGRMSGLGKVNDGADEARCRSLVMDDGVGVSPPAWWRRTAVDAGADGGGWGGEGVLAPTEYEWGNGG